MTDARIPRDADTRERTSRPKTWVDPHKLLEPTPVKGLTFRWIRSSLLGQSDAKNWSSKRREGWEPVSATEQPDLIDFKNEASGHLEYGGLILCCMPDEMVAQRTAHFSKKASDQIIAVDNNVMRESDPRMPMSKPERSTSESFGRGKP